MPTPSQTPQRQEPIAADTACSAADPKKARFNEDQNEEIRFHGNSSPSALKQSLETQNLTDDQEDQARKHREDQARKHALQAKQDLGMVQEHADGGHPMTNQILDAVMRLKQVAHNQAMTIAGRLRMNKHPTTQSGPHADTSTVGSSLSDNEGSKDKKDQSKKGGHEPTIAQLPPQGSKSLITGEQPNGQLRHGPATNHGLTTSAPSPAPGEQSARGGVFEQRPSHSVRVPSQRHPSWHTHQASSSGDARTQVPPADHSRSTPCSSSGDARTQAPPADHSRSTPHSSSGDARARMPPVDHSRSTPHSGMPPSSEEARARMPSTDHSRSRPCTGSTSDPHDPCSRTSHFGHSRSSPCSHPPAQHGFCQAPPRPSHFGRRPAPCSSETGSCASHGGHSASRPMTSESCFPAPRAPSPMPFHPSSDGHHDAHQPPRHTSFHGSTHRPPGRDPSRDSSSRDGSDGDGSRRPPEDSRPPPGETPSRGPGEPSHPGGPDGTPPGGSPHDLCHDLATGRAVTGVLHLVNQTPVDWFTKKQATVETAAHFVFTS